MSPLRIIQDDDLLEEFENQFRLTTALCVIWGLIPGDADTARKHVEQLREKEKERQRQREFWEQRAFALERSMKSTMQHSAAHSAASLPTIAGLSTSATATTGTCTPPTRTSKWRASIMKTWLVTATVRFACAMRRRREVPVKP
jgi:hypothetical protein